MTDSQQLRDSLLAIESPQPEMLAQLQQEMQTMLIRKLSTPRRVLITIIMVADFLAAGLCGSLVVTEQNLPLMARIGLAVGTGFAVAWGAWFARLLWRGQIDVHPDGRWMARMVWCFTLLMVIFMTIVGASTPDRSKALMMISQGIIFLIGAAVYWINHRIEDAELSLTERLLRMELQIAELRQGVSRSL